MVRAAFRAALTGRPGPVFLAIADELLATTIDDAQAPAIYPAARYRVTDMGAGDPAEIERAADALAAAKRPFIHAGKGVLWADGSAELLALAEHLGAGMSATLGGRGVVPENHPHYFHPFDLAGVGMARNEADVILVVGARLGEYDSWGMPPTWGLPSLQTTIQIDADPMSIGLNRPVDIAVVADAKKALAALLARVREKSAARKEMTDLAKYREQSSTTITKGIEYLMQPGTTGLNPGQLVLALREFFPPETITVLDGGNTTLTGVAYHPILTAPSFLYSVKMGYLGTGLPFALGAKLAAPDRPVCAIVGDGAFGFNVMELETAVREKLPVVVIVAVDDAWGMEKTAFAAQGFGPGEWAGRGIDMGAVRYDGIAQMMGCHGELVRTLEELRPALERATAAGKPAVLHVQVDRDLNTTPPGYEQFRKARNTTVY
jgi:acetolactate synthase-1/2/3 large subunit